MAGSEKMFFYYSMLILGALFVIATVIAFIGMYRDKSYPFLRVGKSLGILSFGVLLLAFALPSLKNIVLKEYVVVSGKCVIEIDSAGRSKLVDIEMLDIDEIFTFNKIPTLDAYGKSTPYYCNVTVTKDHLFEINYKIYDDKTRKLILAGK
ncbi:hypothetical protein HPK19_04050 [Arthrobacter citreus]|nr:hypothetical protein HPK19_04050 [Arthrobacter citreus]